MNSYQKTAAVGLFVIIGVLLFVGGAPLIVSRRVMFPIGSQAFAGETACATNTDTTNNSGTNNNSTTNARNRPITIAEPLLFRN